MERMFLEDGLLLACPDLTLNVRGIEDVLGRVSVHWTQGHQIHSAAGSWDYVTAVPADAVLGELGDAALEKTTTLSICSGVLPPSQRLASVFLTKLGHTQSKSSDPLLPAMIELPRAFKYVQHGEWSGSEAAGEEFITLAAKDITSLAERNAENSKTLARASQLYGHGTFSISVREIAALMATTRLVTDETLPKSFFSAVQFSLVDGVWAKYDYVHSHVPASLLGTAFPSLDAQLSEETEFLRSMVGPGDFEEEEDDKAAEGKALYPTDPEKWWWMTLQNKARQQYRKAPHRVEIDQRRIRFNETLSKIVLQESEDCGGFLSDSRHTSYAKTMGLSLSDWSYHVVLSVKTHFFVHSTDNFSNQLCEKPTEPIAAVFGRRVDFCSYEEISKLVGRGPSTTKDLSDTMSISSGTSLSIFSSLKRSADAFVYNRFRTLFTLLFRSVQLQGAKTVVCQPFIDTSTSVFLSQLPPDFISRISSLHFQALYDVLQEEWGVEICYLCGEQYHSWAITAFAAKAYVLKCHLVLHEKDAKHLAIELAKLRRRTALLCPADIWTVLLGRVGSYWSEVDLASTPVSSNPALVDCCATSLVTLSSFGATGEYGLSRICDESDVTGINKWAEVAVPHDFSHFHSYPTSSARKRK